MPIISNPQYLEANNPSQGWIKLPDGRYWMPSACNVNTKAQDIMIDRYLLCASRFAFIILAVSYLVAA